MNPLTSASPSPQAHKRYGALFLIMTLLLLVLMIVSLFLSLRAQETMPDLTDYLTIAALLGLLGVGGVMLRARQQPVVRALRLGTIAGCSLGIFLACLFYLSLLTPDILASYLLFLFVGAIPWLFYSAISSNTFSLQISFFLSPGFLIGSVVQLLLGIALFVPAELTVRRGGSARYGFLRAIVAALYAYITLTLALSIYFLARADYGQQLPNPEDVCGTLLGNQANFPGLCDALVSYKSLCAESTFLLLDFLILAIAVGFIGFLISRLPKR